MPKCFSDSPYKSYKYSFFSITFTFQIHVPFDPNGDLPNGWRTLRSGNYLTSSLCGVA
jgi:hypothetical protein